MKKVLSFLILAVLLSFSWTSVEAQNIYASELKASAVDGDGNVTFTYTLNANASEVVISVTGTSNVFTISSNPGLSKGVNTVTKQLAVGTLAGNYAWTVKATSATTYSGTTLITGLTTPGFWTPAGGIAVDDNPESLYFGRVYVCNTWGYSSAGAQNDAWGIHIFNSAMERFNPANAAAYGGYNGYNTGLIQSTYQSTGPAAPIGPYRMSVTPAGDLLVADCTYGTTSTSDIKIMKANNPAAGFTSIFAGGGTYTDPANGAYSVGGTELHRAIPQAQVVGNDLYFLTANPTNSADYASGGFGMKLIKHANWNPSVPISTAGTEVMTTGIFLNSTASFVPDGKGGWWIGQNRGTEALGQPDVFHIASDGTIDFRSADPAHWGGARMGQLPTGVLGFNKKTNQLTVGLPGTVKFFNTVYSGATLSVPLSTTGNPANIAGADVGGTSANLSGVVYDYANNLYVIGRTSEQVRVFAMAKSPNSETTPAPSSQKVNVTQNITAGIAGTYYIPKSGTQEGWATLKQAFDAINTEGIVGDVTLLITGDISSADNVGLINNTNFSITIKPEEGKTPTITFTKTADNASGISGAFVIGCGTGLNWTDIAPAKNITIDGLKIMANGHAAHFPLVMIDACDKITVKNCTISSTQNLTSTIVLRGPADRTEANVAKVMPKNVTIEGNVLTAIGVGGSGATVINFLNNGTPASSATGTVIKNNIITGNRQRVIWINYVNGMEITENEFNITGSPSGAVCGIILPNAGNAGNMYVAKNKFVKIATSNTYDLNYGTSAVSIGSQGTWIVENNYFSGFDKTSTTGVSNLEAIRVMNSAVTIRHNTFYMNQLPIATAPAYVENPGNSSGTASAYTAIFISGTNTPTIENNLFVSEEDRCFNFFVRGNAPASMKDNVFCLPAGATKAKIASGTPPSSPKMVDAVVFANKATGNLDLTGASIGDANLKVPRLASVLKDIAGTDRKDPTYAGAFEVPAPTGFTVTFDAKGGTPVPPPATVPDGGKVTKPTPDPTKAGFDFKGWYKDFDQEVWKLVANVNLREPNGDGTPNASGTPLISVPSGTEVVLVERVVRDATTWWGKTSYGGFTGWMAVGPTFSEPVDPPLWNFDSDLVTGNITLNARWKEVPKQANIFASELKATAPTASYDVDFSYTLNADASSVVIEVGNGDSFTITTAADLTKGPHTVTKRLTLTATGGEFGWTVKAVGVANSTNVGTDPVKFTDDNELLMKFYSPRGGIAMDKNMDSPFFGRIYIPESLATNGSGVAVYNTQDGIYILNAALQDVNQQRTGATIGSYKGGFDLFRNGHGVSDLTPARIFIAPDGKVFVPLYWGDHSLEIMDPANPGANWTSAFVNNSIIDRPIQTHLIGNDLYVLGCSGLPGSTSRNDFRIKKYENFAIGHTAAATQTIQMPGHTSGNVMTNILGFIPDTKGGWWVASGRANNDGPALMHFLADGTCDINRSFTEVGVSINGVSLVYDEAKNLLYVGTNGNIRVYTLTWTGNAPSLGSYTTLPLHGSTTAAATGIVFDPAGNYYVVSSSSERLTGWAMPKATAADNTFTTTAPSAQKITIVPPLPPADDLNIYAYGLKATKATNDLDVDFSYTLNAKASKVTINVSNGDEFVLTGAADLTKGSHTVTKRLSASTATGDYTWSVTAIAATAVPTAPTKFATAKGFYSPRSLVVDNSTNSPHFGNLYVVNANSGTSDGIATQKGIYQFNPLMQPQNRTAAYGGGVSWNASWDSPYAASVGPDGKVYVTNGTMSTLVGGIYCMDPATPTANWPAVLPASQGVTPYCWVTGTGNDAKIYTMNIGDVPVNSPANWSTTTSKLQVYNIPTLPATSSTLVYDGGTVLPSRVNAFAPGKDGGWWITQSSRTDGSSLVRTDPRTSASLIYIGADKAVKYNSANVPAIHALFNTIGTGSGGSIAVSPDGELIAVYSFRNNQNIQIFKIEYTGDTPSLTFLYAFNNKTGTLDNPGTSALSDYAGLSFDWANNIFVTDAGPETVQAWALPKAANAATTPAPVSQPVSVGEPEIAGDYYVPNDPGAGKKWFPTLKAATAAINIQPITGDVRLIVNGDITSPDNVGLINNTNFSITIVPDAGLKPSITFTRTADDNAGPTGAFIIGAGSIQPGGTGWASIAPAKNITVDGLTIKTAQTANSANHAIVLVDACEDITIKNCVFDHKNGGALYSIYLRGIVGRTEANIKKVMPKNVTIENNEIKIPHGTSQAITILADAAPVLANNAAGVVIKNNIINAGQRAIFLNYATSVEISGNEFHVNNPSVAGALSTAIMGNAGLDGNIKVVGNKFIELKSANPVTGAYGMRAIIASGGGTWYIDNNYFTGFDKTSTNAGPTQLEAIRVGSTCVIRHNTFLMNALTNLPTVTAGTPSDANSSYSAINIAAGTPVIENNLFVSATDALPNFFIRGNAPAAAANNVFSLPKNAVNAKIASGTIPAGLSKAKNVAFENAAAGNLDIAAASDRDPDLKVPFLAAIIKDIHGTTRGTVWTYAGAFEGSGDFEEPPTNIYYVPEDPGRGKPWFPNLQEAFEAFSGGIVEDVVLVVNADITSTDDAVLNNKTNFSVTIVPDEDLTPKITFDGADLIVGGKNVIIEGSERLTFETALNAGSESFAPGFTTGVVISENIFKGGLVMDYVNGIEIIGNTFDIKADATAIHANSNIRGEINVAQNKFMGLTAGSGTAILAEGGSANTWTIENNYFTSIGQTDAAAIALVTPVSANILHNTFYLKGCAASFSAINANPAVVTAVKNNLFVNADNTAFFFTGDVPASAEGNIFSLPDKTKIASGFISADVRVAKEEVKFAGAATGNLDLAKEKTTDAFGVGYIELGVTPLKEVLFDIHDTTRGVVNAGLTYAGAYEGAKFKLPNNIDAADSKDIRIVQEGSQIKITSNKEIQSVRLYDLQGRIIASAQGLSTNVHLMPAPAKGVYVVDVAAKGALSVQKIVIR